MMTRLSQVTVRVRHNDFHGGIGIDDWHDVSVSDSARPHSIVIAFKYAIRPWR
jgi:hypothetical protein